MTGDGFSGLRQAFSDIPYQMCHVHMERILRAGTTRNPYTEAGQVLRALTLSLFATDSTTFKRRYQDYLTRYLPFLNEKTVNPVTGAWEWTHKRLRSASLSLFRHLPYLFTFEDNRKIPSTSNALESRFRHINEIAAVHCGLSRVQKEKLIATTLLASTIAPTKEKLDRIFKI